MAFVNENLRLDQTIVRGRKFSRQEHGIELCKCTLVHGKCESYLTVVNCKNCEDYYCKFDEIALFITRKQSARDAENYGVPCGGTFMW
jgi:hypothetical protein